MGFQCSCRRGNPLNDPLFDVIPVTGSTNADLLDLISRNCPPDEGRWLIADRQRTGRGRHGRTWRDGLGNFMGSVAVQLRDGDPPAQSLALVTGLALFDSVKTSVPQVKGLHLKWPNDLLIDDAKLAGILLERAGGWVVVGVGVNLVDAPVLEDRRAIALAQFGAAIARDAFAKMLADRFAGMLLEWRLGSWPDAIIAGWQNAAHPIGTPLRLTDGVQAGLTGAFDGLERDGSLRLRLADGSIIAVHAGEVLLASAATGEAQKGVG